MEKDSVSWTALLCIAVGLSGLIWLLAGCGDSDPPPPDRFSVEIDCDSVVFRKNRCTVLVYGAEDVRAYYNGRLVWFDVDITETPERRLTYFDSPPWGTRYFSVEACREDECIEDVVELR